MTKPNTTAAALIEITRGVTKRWAKQRKAEERHATARANRIYLMTRMREDTIKDVAYGVMEKAYLAASADDTLPAHARQIMYQARPLIQARTEKPLNDQYFCQQLLPNYIEEKRVAWNVVYDDRGHFAEPHTERVIGLGTLNVRQYLRGMHRPKLIEFGTRSCQGLHRWPRRVVRRRLVRGERGLSAAVRGCASRRTVRHRDHVDQGPVEHGRAHVWSTRSAAAAAFRFSCFTTSTNRVSPSSGRSSARPGDSASPTTTGWSTSVYGSPTSRRSGWNPKPRSIAATS